MTPDENTIQEFQLNVGDGHSLYVHDWGNKDAITPIVHLHGGPGGFSKDSNKLMFDPKLQRVIFHHQRGCGQSTPKGSLENNTTDDLIEDIEKMAKKLQLKEFILTGGSWGSTLALAYAIKYPKRVHTLIVQGVFTGSLQEIKYLDGGLFRTHFPDTWDHYRATVPQEFKANPSEYHFQRILGDNVAAAAESGKIYEDLEGSVVSLDDRHPPSVSDEEYDVIPIRTEVNYMVNGCFMEDRYIVNNARKLTMPLWIIQGRYDFVAPPITAYELSQNAPNAHIIWTEAGHSRNDRQNYDILRTLLTQISLQK